MSNATHTTKLPNSTLIRYKLILEEFNKHDCSEVPITVILKKYITPKFGISRSTLYKAIAHTEQVERLNIR